MKFIVPLFAICSVVFTAITTLASETIFVNSQGEKLLISKSIELLVDMKSISKEQSTLIQNAIEKANQELGNEFFKSALTVAEIKKDGLSVIAFSEAQMQSEVNQKLTVSLYFKENNINEIDISLNKSHFLNDNESTLTEILKDNLIALFKGPKMSAVPNACGSSNLVLTAYGCIPQGLCPSGQAQISNMCLPELKNYYYNYYNSYGYGYYNYGYIYPNYNHYYSPGYGTWNQGCSLQSGFFICN